MGRAGERINEVCDDGNITEGDGCSSDCKIKGAGCSCVPGMKCVCPEVRCGNGTIEGTEKCDDGNANSNDGCSATCQVERGYVCPLIKAPCVPDCGDGILTGNEPCDPGITIQRMACSAQCRWNPGWAARAARSPNVTPPRAATARRKAPKAATTATPALRRLLGDLPGRAVVHRHERRLHGQVRRRHLALGRSVRRRQQPFGRRLLGRLQGRRRRLHVHAAGPRRQHRRAGRLPGLPDPAHPTSSRARPARTMQSRASWPRRWTRRASPRSPSRSGGQHQQRDDRSGTGTPTSPVNHATASHDEAVPERRRQLRQPLASG